MTAFKQVEPEDFADVIARSSASKLFRQQFVRYSPLAYDGQSGSDCFVHDGDLIVAGNFEAPGFFTLITGDLTATGLVDLRNPYDKGFDEGGLCVVLGNVDCRAFANECNKCTFIDGNLHAREIILNTFSDSALVVTGDLKTLYYHGGDIWAEVGGKAETKFGDGYCLPFDYTDAESQAIRPEHDDAIGLLDCSAPRAGEMSGMELLGLLRKGRPIFKGG